MFEKAAGVWALAMFLACALSVMLVMAVVGGFLGVTTAHATLLLLWTLAPRLLVGVSPRMMGVFDLCGGGFGALASTFLTARFCWRHARTYNDPHFQALGRRIKRMARFADRRL